MRSTSLRFALVSFAALTWASAAAAQRAPIEYAGQGAPAAATTHTASLDERLAGGADNSYGYGASTRGQRRGAVIDIRRNGASTSQPVQPARAEPVRLTIDANAEPEETANVAPAPAQSAPGQQPWLERERVGPPYEANRRWYVPTPEPGYAQTGEASWYGPDFHGQATASGETYDQNAMTAAHPTLPLQSLVQVTNLQNGREVIVRVNDRGPFVGERLIDLSHAAADVLGFAENGRARVHVRYLGPAPRRVNADGTSAPAPVAPTPAPVNEVRRDRPAPLVADAGPSPVPAIEQAPIAPMIQQVSYSPPQNAGAYVVQVGAFSDLSNAHRVRAQVEQAGPVQIDTRQTANGELFRVRVGPWTSAGEAEQARRTLASLGYPEAVIAQR